MRKNFWAGAVLIVILAVLVWGFVRWWKGRVPKLAVPVPTLAPTAAPSNLGKLLSHMRPLTVSEQTLELKGTDPSLSGLVRYSLEGSQITYTVFVLSDVEPKVPIFVFLMDAKGTRMAGQLTNEKGGLLLSGTLSKSNLPVVFIVAPKARNEAGPWLLSASLE